MKVKYQESLLYKIEQRIVASSGQIILYRDMTDLADKTQISRALRQLVKKGKLIKIGYGVFAKTYYSARLNKCLLNGNPKNIFIEALSRLNVTWEFGKTDQDYHAGRFTQIPVFTSIKLKSRMRRELSCGDLKLRYE